MPIIHWFRRDYRLHDNTALHHANRDAQDGVAPTFIFDDAILKAPDIGDPIVSFMLGCLAELQANLRQAGGDLILLHGDPVETLAKLARTIGADAIYFNRDYDPAARKRDAAVTRKMQSLGVATKSFKDQVIFEERELLSAASGNAYTVFTPYKNAWLAKLATLTGDDAPSPLPAPKLAFARDLKQIKGIALPTAEEVGHQSFPLEAIVPGESAGAKQLEKFVKNSLADYPTQRNFPAMRDGSSQLSAHLRHGTISPRQALHAMRGNNSKGADTWRSELIWRDFFQQALFNFPHVVRSPLRKNAGPAAHRNSAADFRTWCAGATGFPIVDAGMRQLNAIGWMHNRVRMIVAMFLTKDLLLDYRKGERYFATHLIDYEMAQNNGNWQWCAGTGADAQPFFRIFNPRTQSEKFDPEGAYIRKWCPALARVPSEFIHAPHEMTAAQQAECGCRIGQDYPAPMVDHDAARKRALAALRKTGGAA